MNDNTIELRTLKIVYSESTTIYQRKKKDIRRSNVSMWVAVCRWTLTCSLHALHCIRVSYSWHQSAQICLHCCAVIVIFMCLRLSVMRACVLELNGCLVSGGQLHKMWCAANQTTASRKLQGPAVCSPVEVLSSSTTIHRMTQTAARPPANCAAPS